MAIRAWFDLEPVLAGRDVDRVDGHWKLRREAMRERIGKLAYEGISGFRFLSYGGWTAKGMQKAEDCFAPYQVVNGKFDLDQPNPDYWPIIVEVAEICKEFNCEFVFCLFDHCQFKGDPSWACWRNNVQGNFSYFDDLERSEAFVLQAVNYLGGMKHVSFCVINEGKEIGSRDVALAWYEMVFRALKAGGVAPERIDVGTLLNEGEWNGSEWVRKLVLQDHVKGRAKEVFGEREGKRVWLPVHNVTDRPTRQFPYGPLHPMAMDYFPKLSCRLSNDGNKDKDSTASLILWREMCKHTMSIAGDRKIIFEYLSDADLAGKVKAAQFMAEGLGVENLPNYHRKSYVPEAQPEPEQPLPPTPKPSKRKLWKDIALIALAIAAIIVAVLL